MPQMAPMMWLNLMLMFILVFLLFFIINYYSFTPSKMESEKMSIKMTEKSWKW